MQPISPESARHKHLPVFLLVAFLMFWAFFAFQPVDRFDWLLENILVFIFMPLLLLTYKRFRLSNVSYVCIFIFMMLHTMGAHYTYAEVPLGFWLQALFQAKRNFFDRIVHFSFGLLLAYPVREVFHRIGSARGFWGYWLPFELTLAFSAIYEIIEWIVAVLVAPDAGAAYLGTQGDIWDAQWDMALAGAGALLSMLVTMLVNIRYNKAFGTELKSSLIVKEDDEPLGEVKLEEMEATSLAAKFAARKAHQKDKPLKAAEKEENDTADAGGETAEADFNPEQPEEEKLALPEDIDSGLSNDIEKHNHSPEEILRLLKGENVHGGSEAATPRTVHKTTAARKPGKPAKRTNSAPKRAGAKKKK